MLKGVLKRSEGKKSQPQDPVPTANLGVPSVFLVLRTRTLGDVYYVGLV